jgi:CelD/BcsL family acetyltransferase involved in cellulose biosynthesis
MPTERLNSRSNFTTSPQWSTVFVRLYQTLADLAPLGEAWDALATDCPFRRWTWLSTWWQHFGADGSSTSSSQRAKRRRLNVLLAFDDADANSGDAATLVGILPCYVMSSLAHGRVLRLLGDGEVCSDHLGVIAAVERSQAVAAAFAEHLLDESNDSTWDLVDFDAIDEDDAPTAQLFDELAARRCGIVQYAGPRCWTIDLPGDWEEFLSLQSKSHRKQLRQAERRVLDSDRAAFHAVTDAAHFDAAWDTLIDLHQRRRISLGEPGCFASPDWASFHRAVAARLLDEGALRLSTLTLDGAPIAAEYHLAGARTTFAYQGGVDPARLEEEPGRLSTIRAIQQAIAEGHARFDFLRGDEPYKPHWRATPHPTWRRQATAPRAWPKLRRQTWAATRRVGQFARQLTGLFE